MSFYCIHLCSLNNNIRELLVIEKVIDIPQLSPGVSVKARQIPGAAVSVPAKLLDEFPCAAPAA